MDFLQQLKQYFADTSPEQLEKDYEELREFNNIGPTVDEYLQCVGDIQEINVWVIFRKYEFQKNQY